MSPAQQLSKPVRVGVYDTIQSADRAVEALARMGFTREEVSVLAPESVDKGHFGELAETLESTKSAEGAAAGSAIGAVLGGLAVVAGVVTTAGTGILAAGALGLGLGGVVGGFVGAMSMRGLEKEYVHYYDQSISAGKILVAVETHDESRLALAERLLAQYGAQPVSLPEG